MAAMKNKISPGIIQLASFVISIALVLVISCKGKEHSNPIFPITNQQLRDAVNIREGSYFVYVDSNTNTVDSFGRVTYDSGLVLNTGANQDNEIIAYAMHDQGLNAIGIGATRDGISGNSGILSQGFTNFMAMKFPFEEGKTVKSATGATFSYLNHLASFTVLNKTYNDVYEVESNYQGKTFHTWYSGLSGLIRFKYEHDSDVHVWNLRNSHIQR
jgi:hypothetical protein